MVMVKKYRIRGLVNAGRLKAIGAGPGRRILISSLDKSGLSIQKEMEWTYEDQIIASERDWSVFD